MGARKEGAERAREKGNHKWDCKGTGREKEKEPGELVEMGIKKAKGILRKITRVPNTIKNLSIRKWKNSVSTKYTLLHTVKFPFILKSLLQKYFNPQ